jgi:hypothetical protein
MSSLTLHNIAAPLWRRQPISSKLPAPLRSCKGHVQQTRTATAVYTTTLCQTSAARALSPHAPVNSHRVRAPSCNVRAQRSSAWHTETASCRGPVQPRLAHGDSILQGPVQHCTAKQSTAAASARRTRVLRGVCAAALSMRNQHLAITSSLCTVLQT